MKKYLTYIISTITLTSISFADYENYDGQDVSFQSFNYLKIHRTLNYSSWRGSKAIGTSFSNNSYIGADFTDAVITFATFYPIGGDDGFTAEMLYSTASYKNKDLSGITLQAKDLTYWNFSGQNLTGANFAHSRLTNTDFSNANLTDATLYRDFADQTFDLSGANFSGAILKNTAIYDFRGLGSLTIDGANFTGAKITDTTMEPRDT